MEIPPVSAYMRALMTAFMSIPGHIDPVPVPRPEKAADADARVNLVGLSKAEIRAALAAAGLDEQAGEIARQAALASDLQSRRHGLRGDERHRQAAARLARRAFHRRPARDRHRAGLDRRHPQMAAAHPRRPRLRDGVHPRRGSRHLVRLQPGRLHPQLPLLPYRHDAAGPQPRRRRDCRPGHARPRFARRMAPSAAEQLATIPKAECSPTS